MNFLLKLFSSDGFLPHGHCYLWDPLIMWLNVISDGLIALAYLTIPVTLIYIARKRKDLPFNWMFACFGIFILACGATHALEIWTLWIPTYWLLGTTKAVTAAASVATAILLVKLIPQLLAIPSPATLRKTNAALQEEVAERRRAEEALLRQQTEQRVIFDLTPAMICVKDTQNRHSAGQSTAGGIRWKIGRRNRREELSRNLSRTKQPNSMRMIWKSSIPERPNWGLSRRFMDRRARNTGSRPIKCRYLTTKGQWSASSS